jgi:hypothetical protein
MEVEASLMKTCYEGARTYLVSLFRASQRCRNDIVHAPSFSRLAKESSPAQTKAQSGSGALHPSRLLLRFFPQLSSRLLLRISTSLERILYTSELWIKQNERQFS